MHSIAVVSWTVYVHRPTTTCGKMTPGQIIQLPMLPGHKLLLMRNGLGDVFLQKRNGRKRHGAGSIRPVSRGETNSNRAAITDAISGRVPSRSRTRSTMAGLAPHRLMRFPPMASGSTTSPAMSGSGPRIGGTNPGSSERCEGGATSATTRTATATASAPEARTPRTHRPAISACEWPGTSRSGRPGGVGPPQPVGP